MKWRLYQLCSLCNIILASAYTLLFLYFILQEHFKGLEDYVVFFVFLLATASFILKNYMGNILFNNEKNKTSHRDRFGLGFYFLWFVSLTITIILGWIVYDTYSSNNFVNIFDRSVTDQIIILSILLLLLTSFYTLIFDIPLERKVRKQHNTADELFKEQE